MRWQLILLLLWMNGKGERKPRNAVETGTGISAQVQLRYNSQSKDAGDNNRPSPEAYGR
jgi:hypothetical protein